MLATFAGEAPLVSRPPEAFTVPVQLIFDNVRVRTDDDDHPYRVQYSNKELSIINSIFVDPGVKVTTCIGSESGKADTVSFYLTPSYPCYDGLVFRKNLQSLAGQSISRGVVQMIAPYAVAV